MLKLLTYLAVGKKSYFDFPIDQQNKFIDELGEAKDIYDRSHKQFICQQFFVPWPIRAAVDLASYVSFPLIFLLLLIRGVKEKPLGKVECIGQLKGMEEIAPVELRDKYNINNDYWNGSRCLVMSDIGYALKLFLKYPFSPTFVLKTILNIAQYRRMIKCWSPSVIITHGEFSYTSSILTDYCRKNHIKHINVMHGEKLYNIRDSYFEFDECYVWDEYYVDMLKELKAEPLQFIVALPPSMKIDCEKNKNNAVYADYKYYLATTKEDQLKKIVDSMAFATKEGKTVKYRLHPRYSDADLVEKIVGKENVEYPRETNIIDSIANCGCAVGSYTTVLNQAHNSGVAVMIDDVAEKEMFDKLKSFKYILINKGLPLLSNMQ